MTDAPNPVDHRLHLLEQYIAELERYQARGLDELHADMGLAWTVEHGLQLAIQCVIDICYYLVAQGSLGAPDSSPDTVLLLRDAGAFPSDFAETLVEMVRFRNILVHVYAQVDLDRVHAALQTGLDDFRRFARYVVEFQSPTATDAGRGGG